MTADSRNLPESIGGENLPYVFVRDPAGHGTGAAAVPSGVSLRALLRRRWPLILAVAVPVFAMAALYTYFAPRLYESESSFLLDPGTGDAGSSLALLDRIGRVSHVENEVELLRSRRVVGPTVAELGLHVSAYVDDLERRPDSVLPEFSASADARPGGYSVAVNDSTTRVRDTTGQVLGEWTAGDTVGVDGLSWLAGTGQQPDIRLEVRSFDAGVAAVQKTISVGRVGNEADLVRLTCTARSPEMARDLCVSISDSYLKLRNELQVTEASNAREWLGEAVEDIKGRLTAAEDSLADFARRTGAVALDVRAQAEVRNLAMVTADRDMLIAERSALSQFLQSVAAGEGGSERYRELASFPTFLNNEAVTEHMTNLIELDNRRSELSRFRSDSNPEVATLDARIGRIEDDLLSIASSYQRALTAKIESFDQTLGTGSSRVAGIPARQVEFLRRQRQVDQLEQMYTTLEARRREAELAEGVSTPSVRPIDAPQLSASPSSPSVALNLALGSVLGLGLGLLLAGYREYSDVRVRNREELESATGARVIGMLPTVKRPGPLLVAPPPRGQTNGRDVVTRTGAPPGWKKTEWQPAIEAFRTLVADLKIAVQNGAGRNGDGKAPLRTLAVVSSAQGEGKTYTACNLALVWASMGARTLLIDADLRVGRVAEFFSLPGDSVGLGDVLKGAVHPSTAYQQINVAGGNVLHVLTAGQTAAEDTDAFHVEGRIPDAFDVLERDFDLIVIDTPPLNVVSDSAIVAAASDAVLFVVRSGVTRPDALELAMARLRRMNRNLVGLVLNDVTLPSYYSNYYGAERA